MAAAEALGLEYSEGLSIYDVMYFLEGRGHDSDTLRHIIELNDGAKLSREEIADIVETIYESVPKKPRESDADYTKRVLASILEQTADNVEAK
jgi:hypothetical protein